MADQTADTTDVFAPPLSALPADITIQQTAEMQRRVPGWRPIAGKPDTNLLAVAAQISAEGRAAMQDRFKSEIRDLLGTIFGVTRNLGVGATTTITITAVDDAGHPLDAGSTVHIGDVETETVEDLVIPPGSTTGSVGVRAVAPGAAANGTTGPVEIDALDWISDTPIALSGPLSGGADPETDEAYGARIAEQMQILWPTPVTAENAAIWVRRFPIVGWSWAIKGYNPNDNTFNNKRTVCIVVTTADGTALLETDMDMIRDAIAATRETNWNVYVVAPNYVPVDIDATVVVEPDHDPATVLAGETTLLTSALKPGAWMRPQPGESTPANYQPDIIIHKNTLIAIGSGLDGVRYFDDLQVNGGDQATMPSPISLPQPGTITITEA